MKQYLVVIDTNVLVSSLITKHMDSSTVKILELVFASIIIPLYDDEILNEYNEVLHRKKFNFSENNINKIIDIISTNGMFTERLNTNEKLPDPKDLVFYEVCMSKKESNSILVTGNIKHFPNKTFIVTPNELLDIIIQENN